MSEPITAAERKRQVQANFDSIAARYDALGFVQVCATRLLERANLAPGARVLDLATGTGLVAAAAAQLVGPSGAVFGLDLAPEMLAQARHRGAARRASACADAALRPRRRTSGRRPGRRGVQPPASGQPETIRRAPSHTNHCHTPYTVPDYCRPLKLR